MPAQGPAQGPGVAHAQVPTVEGVLHREEARPFPGRQLRHPDPALAGKHAAVVRLHVADDGQAGAVTDAVQRAIEHCQPPLVREGLGVVRLGVTHQALELLTGRFDVGPVNRVRLPAPAVAVVWQPDGPPAREDGGAPRPHLVEAGRFVAIDEHCPRRPASRQAHARSGPSGRPASKEGEIRRFLELGVSKTAIAKLQTAERHAGLSQFAAGRRGVPPHVPLDFAPAALQPLIRHDGVTDRRRWESAFLKVRDEIQTGNLAIDGAKKLRRGVSRVLPGGPK